MLSVSGWLIVGGAAVIGWAARDAVQVWVERGRRPARIGGEMYRKLTERAGKVCPDPRCAHPLSYHTPMGCDSPGCGCKAIPS